MITLGEREFKQLSKYIHENFGIYLKEEKRTLVLVRLKNVLEQCGFKSFNEYYRHIISSASESEVIKLVDSITTNHTFFMREPEHFHYFKNNVLPFLKDTVKDRDLRIWCAASSTGEEPYTLAMILDEYFGAEKIYWDTKVLATDISTKVLDSAKCGVYSKDRMKSLPDIWIKNYFENYDSENMVIKDNIKKEVIYRKFNLINKIFPFKKKFHTIFCRNVMIYFDDETKIDLVNKFYNHMEDGGYLFIGHSESLYREKTKFKYVMPAVYRKE